MSSLIIIEGLIGAGKSHLTRELSSAIGAKPMYEPVESNPYLEKFYKDPKRYGLEMQFWLMSNRYAMHQEAIKTVWQTGQSVVMDRSIYGDNVFCSLMHQQGYIDDDGYKNYLNMRNVMTNTLMVPHTTIYLAADPQKCLERISLRGRNCEKSIPVDYLNGLHENYLRLLGELSTRGSNVHIISWNEFKAVGYVLDSIGYSTTKNFKEYRGVGDQQMNLPFIR